MTDPLTKPCRLTSRSLSADVRGADLAGPQPACLRVGHGCALGRGVGAVADEVGLVGRVEDVAVGPVEDLASGESPDLPVGRGWFGSPLGAAEVALALEEVVDAAVVAHLPPPSLG